MEPIQEGPDNSESVKSEDMGACVREQEDKQKEDIPDQDPGSAGLAQRRGLQLGQLNRQGTSVSSRLYDAGKRQKLQELKRSTSKNKSTAKEIVLEGKSCFIFSPENKIRLKVRSLVKHPYFENFIYYLIALNSLLLALDEPNLDKESYVKHTIDVMVTIISIAFIIEALLKIIAMGFVCGKHAYLRDSWNILDFIIVMTSIANWIIEAIM